MVPSHRGSGACRRGLTDMGFDRATVVSLANSVRQIELNYDTEEKDFETHHKTRQGTSEEARGKQATGLP